MKILKRGSRDYLYGPDIFTECIHFLRMGDEDILEQLNFSIHGRVTGNIRFELNPNLTTISDIAAVLKCRFKNKKQVVAVVEESLDATVDKINYDEEGLVSDAYCLESGDWSVKVKGKAETFLHIIVGLNKKMLSSIVDMPEGAKWSFVRFVSRAYFPEKLMQRESVTLSYQGCFNDSLYKTKVEGVGDLYFHLSEVIK